MGLRHGKVAEQPWATGGKAVAHKLGRRIFHLGNCNIIGQRFWANQLTGKEHGDCCLLLRLGGEGGGDEGLYFESDVVVDPSLALLALAREVAGGDGLMVFVRIVPTLDVARKVANREVAAAEGSVFVDHVGRER